MFVTVVHQTPELLDDLHTGGQGCCEPYDFGSCISLASFVCTANCISNVRCNYDCYLQCLQLKGVPGIGIKLGYSTQSNKVLRDNYK